MDYPILPARKPKWVKCVDEELVSLKNPTLTDTLRLSVVYPEKLKAPFKRGLPLKKGYQYKDYQLKVLEWCCGKTRGYLSLQMGLGKTLLGISIPACDYRSEMPALIVCPLNVLDEWVTNGFKKFFGTFYRYYVLHQSWSKKNKGPEIKNLSFQDLKNYDYIITTYDTVCASFRKRGANEWYQMTDDRGKGGLSPVDDSHLDPEQKGVALIHSVKWSHVIFDEIHGCSNHRTVTAKACYKICRHKSWGLSGTKVRNNLAELWFQIKVLHFPVSEVAYKYDIRSDIEKIYQNKRDYIFEADYKVAKITLPPAERNVVTVDFDREHKNLYYSRMGFLRNALDDFQSGEKTFSHVLECFLHLRQVSISPQILDPKLGVGNKIKEIVKFLKNSKEKTIIMSSFNSGLDILRKELEKEGISHSVFTGKVPVKIRNDVIKEFREKTSVLLANYRVAGVGLNLQFATQWISLEPWWNESIHRQGYQRIWRPGQEKTCKFFFYTFPGIEKAILKMAGEKNDIATGAEGKDLDFNKITLDKNLIERLISFE